MTASLQRLCMRLGASRGHVIPDAEFVAVFHEWIQRSALDLVALDVADYAHVPDGPGVMLVTHSLTFALERFDGQLGLLAQRRRPVDGDTADAIVDLVLHTVVVASHLEQDSRFLGRLRFERSPLRIESNDRLLAPNTDAGYATIAAHVGEAWSRLYPGIPHTLARVENDPRDRLAVEVCR